MVLSDPMDTLSKIILYSHPNIGISNFRNSAGLLSLIDSEINKIEFWILLLLKIYIFENIFINNKLADKKYCFHTFIHTRRLNKLNTPGKTTNCMETNQIYLDNRNI